MCTPIVIDTPQIDLSGQDTKTATGDPAGVGTPTPGTDAVTQPTASTGGFVPPVNGFLPLPEDRNGGAGVVSEGGMGPNPEDPTGGLGTPATATPTTPAAGTSDPLVDQNTLLINSLTELAHKFTDTTSSILGAQTDATNALKDGFLDLSQQQKDALTAADQLRKNTGQAARKPNYSLSLAANRRANAKGASSTMLTGAGGVPTNQLALGRAQLLGGAAA